MANRKGLSVQEKADPSKNREFDKLLLEKGAGVKKTDPPPPPPVPASSTRDAKKGDKK